MTWYISRRLLLMLPTLVLVTLLAFALCIHAPGDPVGSECLSWEDGIGVEAAQRCRENRMRALGLDLPLFYLSVASLAEPQSLYDVKFPEERAVIRRMLYHYGNPEAVMAYRETVLALLIQSRTLNPPASGGLSAFDTGKITQEVQRQCQTLLRTGDPVQTGYVFGQLDSLFQHYPFFSPLDPAWQAARDAWTRLPETASRWRYYVPWIHWHGTANQYHRWISRFVQGDMGISYSYKRPVLTQMSGAIGWTVLFTLLTVLFAYLLSIPLGIWAAAHAGRTFDRVSSIILFGLHALPAFWVATLLRVAFHLDLPFVFEEQAAWSEMPRQMLLPLIAYTYGAFTYLSRTLRASLLEVLQEDYIRTARAAGLSEWRILTRHALRNAWGPMITLFAGVLPALISGSVILERIFDIEGMGNAIYEATLGRDVPVLLAFFFLTGCLTILGYLLADILYAVADPRITHRPAST